MIEFFVYSTGLCYSSVCTSLSDEEAIERLNEAWPTGIPSQWRIADEPFRTGEANPCPCEQKPETHRHILFNC